MSLSQNAHWSDVKLCTPKQSKRKLLKYTKQKLILTYSHNGSSVYRQRRTPGKARPSRLAKLFQTSTPEEQMYGSDSPSFNHSTRRLSRNAPPTLSLSHGSQSPYDNLDKVVTGREVLETSLPHRDGLEPMLAGTAQPPNSNRHIQ